MDTAKEAQRHLIRLANTKDDEYLAERKAWDEKSIDYAWALIAELDAAQTIQE